MGKSLVSCFFETQCTMLISLAEATDTACGYNTKAVMHDQCYARPTG